MYLRPMRFNASNKTALFILMGLLCACASTSVPPNFLYETSLRGEQGFIGRGDRLESAGTLLEAGIVSNPALALEAALPNAQVKVKRWGVKYFGSDWSRYQTVLDANITRDGETVKCRMAVPDTAQAAPTLEALRANDGAVLQRQLDGLVTECLAKIK